MHEALLFTCCGDDQCREQPIKVPICLASNSLKPYFHQTVGFAKIMKYINIIVTKQSNAYIMMTKTVTCLKQIIIVRTQMELLLGGEGIRNLIQCACVRIPCLQWRSIDKVEQVRNAPFCQHLCYFFVSLIS